MPTPAQLDAFTLMIHREALARMREQPMLIEQAKQVLQRWDTQRGLTASEPYLQQWRNLLGQGVDAIEQATCKTNDQAATLRNVSPLGFIVPNSERVRLRKDSMKAHS
jgi:hypothetical protein